MLLAGMAFTASPALADDLRDALNSANVTSPTLQAARAQQRAVDENVPINRAAGLPSLNGSAGYTQILKDSSSVPGSTPARQGSASLDLAYPVYSGGAVKNSVKAAEVRVKAGQADLRGTESAVFSQVVATYMDVILNEAIVGLNRKNVNVLEVNLKATRDRYEIGDLTRTDVAQSESRLAVARGDLRLAEANLAAARERYIQFVGKPPENLQPPPPLPGLPASPEEAANVALENNPDLIAARERSKASGYDIKVAGSSRLPQVSVFTGGNYNNFFGSLGTAGQSFDQATTGATAGVQASIPLFQGGRPAALRRQAQAASQATLENEIAAERNVIAQVRAAYSALEAAEAIAVSSQNAVDAATLSLEGVRAENTVGNRTILDILNAEQELLSASVQLVTAKRSAYVAGFTLLAAMGKAEARDLGLEGGTLYDPEVNYKRVHHSIWDWGNDPEPVAKSTRTVDTPTQNGSISPE
jgi:outer membrane protein